MTPAGECKARREAAFPRKGCYSLVLPANGAYLQIQEGGDGVGRITPHQLRALKVMSQATQNHELKEKVHISSFNLLSGIGAFRVQVFKFFSATRVRIFLKAFLYDHMTPGVVAL